MYIHIVFFITSITLSHFFTLGIVPMFAEQMFKEIEAKKDSGITFEVSQYNIHEIYLHFLNVNSKNILVYVDVFSYKNSI